MSAPPSTGSTPTPISDALHANGYWNPNWDPIAEALNMHKSAVQRAVREMRAELAGAFDDARWNDPSKTSAVQVARAWLERHAGLAGPPGCGG